LFTLSLIYINWNIWSIWDLIYLFISNITLFMISIGIIGNGFVGKATSLFENTNTNLYIYDIDHLKCKPLGTTLEILSKCDIIFVCVPTPSLADGSCNISIVEKVVAQIYYFNPLCNIVVRSTVPSGTCENIGCFHMPEFLTEKNWENDFVNCKLWIVGYPNICNERIKNFENIFTILLDNAFTDNKIKFKNFSLVKTNESELIKYFRNTFLSTKIAFCNEIYTLCQALNIDYDTVSQLACADARIGSSHIIVPGHDGKRGFGGTCFPKDLSALIATFKKENISAPVLTAVEDRNDSIDRPSQEWKDDPRSFTNS